jgi:hypothetical protein
MYVLYVCAVLLGMASVYVLRRQADERPMYCKNRCRCVKLVFLRIKGVFGWVVALGKAVVGCGCRKSSFHKVAAEWMKNCLVELL